MILVSLPLILFSAFTAVLLFSSQILKFFFKSRDLMGRLKNYIETEIFQEKELKKNPSRLEFKSGLGMIAKEIKRVRFLDNYKKTVYSTLSKAHLLLKPEEFITVCFVCSLIAAFLGIVLFTIPYAAVPGLAVGWMTPVLFLKSKGKKRINQLNEQLGDAIMLLSNSLKAGYSFFQAIDSVTKEMDGPIAEELILLQKEINFGLSTEKALENLVTRVASDDLDILVTAVLIQRQIGGNLSEVLDNISSTIRDRIKIKGEVKTITAQGRMSGMVLSLLPVVLCVLVYFISPAHMSVLFTEPLGIAILVFSGLMEFIGILFIRRIVKIDI